LNIIKKHVFLSCLKQDNKETVSLVCTITSAMVHFLVPLDRLIVLRLGLFISLLGSIWKSVG